MISGQLMQLWATFVFQKKCFYDSKHFPDVWCHFQYFFGFWSIFFTATTNAGFIPVVGEPRPHTMLASILVLGLSLPTFSPNKTLFALLSNWMQTERIHTLLFRWGFISFSLHQWLAQTYKDLFVALFLESLGAKKPSWLRCVWVYVAIYIWFGAFVFTF